MWIKLDENIPVTLITEFVALGHDVDSVFHEGRSKMLNRLKKPAVFPVLLASAVGCGATQVTVMFFPTDLPTLYAERGDSVSLMFLQPSASGTKYQGRNETFWEHQGEAKVTWGYVAPEMHCKKLP